MGDWIAEGFGLGFAYSGVLFGSLIALTALAYYGFNANAVACFWIAYVLTRPLGASCGDLLSQPTANGGLGLGTTAASVTFLIVIVSAVLYLTRAEQRGGTALSPR